MKIVCIYHSIDLDGWMSAAIVKRWFLTNHPEGSINNELIKEEAFMYEDANIDFIGYSYGQPIPDLSEYDKVIMCDISFPKEEMSKLWHNLSKKLIWIDHHISAIKDNDDLVFDGIRDTSFAACELTWKYFFPKETMPEIVRLLGMYDSFRHKGTDEEQKVLEFQYGARQRLTCYEDCYEELGNANEFYTIRQKGKAIYQYLCAEAKQIYKNGFKTVLWEPKLPTDSEIRPISATGICDICGKEENKQLIRYYFRYENDKCDCHSPYHFDVFDCCQECQPSSVNKVPKKFLCINKERFNPINFGIDYHKDGYDGCACFHYANGVWNFSLYNDNGKVDCSQIAKQYGGGGHKGAAGFKLSNEDFNKLINNEANQTKF